MAGKEGNSSMGALELIMLQLPNQLKTENLSLSLQNPDLVAHQSLNQFLLTQYPEKISGQI